MPGARRSRYPKSYSAMLNLSFTDLVLNQLLILGFANALGIMLALRHASQSSSSQSEPPEPREVPVVWRG